MEYESQLLVLNNGGKVISDATGIEVQGATEVTIFLLPELLSLTITERISRENIHISSDKSLSEASSKSYSNFEKIMWPIIRNCLIA